MTPPALVRVVQRVAHVLHDLHAPLPGELRVRLFVSSSEPKRRTLRRVVFPRTYCIVKKSSPSLLMPKS